MNTKEIYDKFHEVLHNECIITPLYRCDAGPSSDEDDDWFITHTLRLIDSCKYFYGEKITRDLISKTLFSFIKRK